MGKHRIYASGKDRVWAFRARQRAEAAHRLDAPTQPVVAVVDHADPVGALAEWSRKKLMRAEKGATRLPNGWVNDGNSHDGGRFPKTIRTRRLLKRFS